MGKVIFGAVQISLGLFFLYMVVFRYETLKGWFKPRQRQSLGSKALVQEEWGPVKKWAVLFGIGILLVGGFIVVIVITNQ